MGLLDIIIKWTHKRVDLILVIALSITLMIHIHTNVVVGVILYGLVLIKRRRICVDCGDFLLFFGTFTWRMFVGYGILDAIFYSVGLTIIYQLGKTIPEMGDSTPEKSAMNATLVVASFFYLKGLLNFSYLLRDKSAIVSENWPMINGKIISRTQHEIFLTIMAALLGFFIISSKRNRYCTLGMIASVSCIVLGIIVKGRMCFFSCLGALIVVLIGYSIEFRLYRRRIFKVLTGLIAILMITMTLGFIYDFFGFQTWYKNSFWSGSGGIISNTRFKLMYDSIKLLKDYPFGRCEVPLVEYSGQTTYYAHNSWLEIGRQGGIIPLILTAGFTVWNIIIMVMVWLKSKEYEKYAVIGAFTGLTLFMSFEPAVLSDLAYWSTELLLGGLIVGVSYRYGSHAKRVDFDYIKAK